MERKVVVELQLANGNALVNLGKLEIETKEYQRELAKLNKEIAANGVATKQQQLRVAELAISIRRNQTVVRELKNDLSGATAAGLRFRDKMAEASRAGLGAFGLQAFSIAAVTTATIAAVRELADLAATIELVDARNKSIAGDSLPAFTAAAEANAEAIGLTRRQYVSLAADQALRLKQLGIEGDIVTELSTKTVEYAEQLSDFSGGQLDTEQAAKLLNDALTGQTRGLKELGINVKASKDEIDAIADSLVKSKGLTKEQATAVATLQLAFKATEDTMKVFGDQTLRIDEAQDRATARINEAKESLAEGLAPAFARATEAGAGLLDLFSRFAQINFGGPEGLTNVIKQISTEANAEFKKGIDKFLEIASDAQIRAAQLEVARQAARVAAIAKGDAVLEAEVRRLSDLYHQLGTGIKGAAVAQSVLTTTQAQAAPTVGELRDKVKVLREEREALKVTDEAGLKTNAEAIAVLEKQIAALDGKTKKTKELTAAQKEQIELEKLIAGLDSGKDVLSKPQQSLVISPDKDPRVEHEAIVNDLLNTKYQENAKNYENAQDLKLEAQEASLEASGALAGSLAGLFDQQSEEFKAFAVIEALISTYLGAARALADNTIPNTFARIAAASAVVLTGLAAVKRIQGFEEGGYTDRASSNKKAVGVVHANEYVVPAPILKTSRGKALVDELEAMRMRHPIRTEIPFVSGGRTTRGSALVNTPRTGVTSDTIASADLARAIANMPTPIVRVTDINDVQGAVARTRVTASL